MEVRSAWAQIWDIPPVALEKVHWVLPRRRCRCCAKTTTAVVAFAVPYAVAYGPNTNAAAVLLASQGNVPAERTAGLMAALVGAPVSTGFVARAQTRLAQRLDEARFDEAMVAALGAEAVLGADESPVNVLRPDLDEAGQPVAGAAHVLVIRTPDQRLVWLRALYSRCGKAIRDLGVLDGYPCGVPLSDHMARPAETRRSSSPGELVNRSRRFGHYSTTTRDDLGEKIDPSGKDDQRKPWS
jgi:hypothetical protein